VSAQQPNIFITFLIAAGIHFVPSAPLQSLIPTLDMQGLTNQPTANWFYYQAGPVVAMKGLESDRLCGLVVRVLGYRSGGPGSIHGTTKKRKSSGSGTGCTQAS
jgi:hypothetical protein